MANPVAVTAQAVDIDSDRSTDSIPLETIPEPWIVLDSTSTIGQICTNLQRFRKSVRGYNTVYKSGGLESPLGCSKNVETCNGSCNSQHSVTDLIWNEPRELIRISTKIEDSFQSLRRVPPICKSCKLHNSFPSLTLFDGFSIIGQDELLLSIPLTDKFLSLCYDNSMYLFALFFQTTLPFNVAH